MPSKFFPSATARRIETEGTGEMRLGSSGSKDTTPARKPSQMRPSGDETAVGNGRIRCGALGKPSVRSYKWAQLLQCATGATVVTMKSRTVTQRELRNQSAAVLREVEAGRTIIVSRNGTPVGELRPLRRRRFVPRAAIAEAAGRAARIDAAQFRADLDAVVDPRIHD